MGRVKGEGFIMPKYSQDELGYGDKDREIINLVTGWR
jgi:hypothetical protein